VEAPGRLLGILVASRTSTKSAWSKTSNRGTGLDLDDVVFGLVHMSLKLGTRPPSSSVLLSPQTLPSAISFSEPSPRSRILLQLAGALASRLGSVSVRGVELGDVVRKRRMTRATRTNRCRPKSWTGAGRRSPWALGRLQPRVDLLVLDALQRPGSSSR